MLGVSYQGRLQFGVTGMRPVRKSCQRHLPMAEIREADECAGADAEHLFQHFARAFDGLQGARENHIVEGIIWVLRKVVIRVAMHHRQAMGDGVGHFRHVDFDAARVASAGAEQMFDERHHHREPISSTRETRAR